MIAHTNDEVKCPKCGCFMTTKDWEENGCPNCKEPEDDKRNR